MQALNITTLDENMQVIGVERVETSATQSEQVINVQNSSLMPANKKVNAFLINHGCHGYGKFGIDEMTLRAFETGLHKIESSLDRKQVYNMMYDLLKS